MVKSSVNSEYFSGSGDRQHLMAETDSDLRLSGSSFTVLRFTFSVLPGETHYLKCVIEAYK